MGRYCFWLAAFVIGCSGNSNSDEKNSSDTDANSITDTDAEDTDSSVEPVLISPGQIIITEIMHNPKAVQDRAGEWFELYNISDVEVNVKGLKIGTRFTVEAAVTDDLLMAPNGYLVFGNNGDSTTNGGVEIDHSYTDLNLGNNGKELVVSFRGVIIDAVDYGAPGFPDPNGASISLNADSFSDITNDDGSSWCTATSNMGSGDLGTPGQPNDDCADIIGTDSDGDGYGSVDSGGSDCDDSNPDIHPAAPDYDNDGIDQDCDGTDFVLGACRDACEYAGDGDCDDGGSFAAYNLCAFGSDCSDCGPRLDLDQDGQYSDQGGTPLNSELVMDCDDNDPFTYYGAGAMELAAATVFISGDEQISCSSIGYREATPAECEAYAAENDYYYEASDGESYNESGCILWYESDTIEYLSNSTEYACPDGATCLCITGSTLECMTDADEDGYADSNPPSSVATPGEDCDDTDANINPSAEEIPNDGIDQDCTGADLESMCDDSCASANDGVCQDGDLGSFSDLCDLGTDCSDCGDRYDGDGDGYGTGVDCDDANPNIYPGQSCDSCDGIDDDGDGIIDEDYDLEEPTDSGDPIDIGTLDDGTLEVSGYLTHADDQDAFLLYSNSSGGTGADFDCVVTAPQGLDIEITLIRPSGNTYDTGSVSGGDSYAMEFGAGWWWDHSGEYTLVLDADGSSSCQPYIVTCFYDYN